MAPLPTRTVAVLNIFTNCKVLCSDLSQHKSNSHLFYSQSFVSFPLDCFFSTFSCKLKVVFCATPTRTNPRKKDDLWANGRKVLTEGIATSSCKEITLVQQHIWMPLCSHLTASSFCTEMKTSSQSRCVCSHSPFKLLLYSALTCLVERSTMSLRLNEAPASYHFLASPWSRGGRAGQFVLSALTPFASRVVETSRQTDWGLVSPPKTAVVKPLPQAQTLANYNTNIY